MIAEIAEQIHFVGNLDIKPSRPDERVWYNVYYSCLPSRQRGLDSRHSHHFYGAAIRFCERIHKTEEEEAIRGWKKIMF